MESKTVRDEWIKTCCSMCYNGCGTKVHVVDGVATKIEGNTDCPNNEGRLCAKGNAAIMNLYSPDRLKTPLKRTNPEKGKGVDPQWEEISWNEALDTISQKLKKIRKEDPRKLVWESFDLANQVAMRGTFMLAFGTPKMPNLSVGAADWFCGNGLHPISYITTGAFAKEVDVHHCNYLILFGAQSGHAIGEHAMIASEVTADAKSRGMKHIAVDPILGPAAAKADEWIPLRPGTDAAFVLAMINVLLNELGIYDAEFLKKYANGSYLIGPDGHYIRDEDNSKPLVWDTTDGKAKYYDDPSIKDFALEGSYKVNGITGRPSFELLKEHVKKYTCEYASEITTVPAETIRRIATEFGEAARIGSTIVIDGKELPYRPACAHNRKGPSQHKHSLLNCFAIQLLNIIIGNVGMPGGSVGVCPVLLPNKLANFSWSYSMSQDGMMVPGGRILKSKTSPYPPPEAAPPENVFLRELTPMAVVVEPMGLLNILNPKEFKFPYKPEVLFQSRTNLMMTTGNPEQRAEWFRKFDMVVSFAVEIDETTEMADIVLPDSHFLEKLEAGVSGESEQNPVGLANDWCFQIRQPVVEAPPGVRNWNEVLLEIAERVGFLGDIYHMLNLSYDIHEPYKLDINKKYTWEEICERLIVSEFNPEHDLAWFKENGFIKWPKKVEEVYPTQFFQARTPIYLEHIIKVGEGVKRVTEEMGIKQWDVSDYQPLPDWKPCPAYEEKEPEFDLYAVNYKIAFHTFSITGNNPWLNEVSEYHPSAYNILMNAGIAKKKGIKDGAIVSLETKSGDKVTGRIKLTEGIHPEVIGIAGCFGHWAARLTTAKGKGVHYNTLLRASLETIDPVTQAMDTCIKVKVRAVAER